MKSNNTQLRQRGYIEDDELDDYIIVDKNKLLDMLHSKIPYERTIAARLLAKYNDEDAENGIKNLVQGEMRMIRGIAIFGLNGGGKSTLTHALANRIDYFEMDVEDYYFPTQRESRKWVLDNNIQNNMEHIGELPFLNPRSKREVQQSLIEDISSHSKFIISGVTMNWSDEIISRIDIAFWVKTPLDVRLKRIKTREEKRFGVRVLDGGDMYLQQLDFQNVVKNRDSKEVEECAKKFNCPIIEIDGTLSVEQSLERIMDNLSAYK